MFFIINIGSTRLDLARKTFDFLDLLWAAKLFNMTQDIPGCKNLTPLRSGPRTAAVGLMQPNVNAAQPHNKQTAFRIVQFSHCELYNLTV